MSTPPFIHTTAHVVSPLELPELLQIISNHLDNHDLLSCILVCTSWHKLFVSTIWRSAFVSTEYTGHSSPSTNAISKYAPLIKSLTFNSYITPDHARIHFPILDSLCVTEYNQVDTQQTDTSEAILIRQNPSITKLECIELGYPPGPSFWEAIRDLPSLRSLELTSTCFPPECADIFWETCSRLDKISFFTSNVPAIPENKKYSFKAKHVDLQGVYGDFSPLQQLDWLKQCNELQSLKLRIFMERSPFMDFCQCATQGVWPNLHALDLSNCQITDGEQEILIGSLSQLTKLIVTNTGFGPLAFTALSRHCTTLQQLDIKGCQNVESHMVQTVMCSSPNLLSLKAGSIKGQDIKKMDGISQKWVCTQLRELGAYFDLDGLDSQLPVLEGLASLTQLEQVDFGVGTNYLGRPPTRLSIKLSLDKGLDMLKSWRRLSSIRFEGTPQTLSMREVDWIILNWKSLETVNGWLSNNFDHNQQLKTILEGRKIMVNKI
ncbi:hypothetical protein BGZ76_007306 [Entomortierella beljakovae]|nr:hypothetical protein BGZ76_007306 [Entomortierella beljakovae]